MRYTIPTKKEDRRKEASRILHAAATDKELQKLRKTLKWLFACTNGTIPYSRKNYDKLYDIYKMLGVTDGKKESAMFPAANRNEENFKGNLDQLWRILEVYAQEKGSSLLTSYQNYKKNKRTYDNNFQTFDRELRNQRLGQRLPEPADLPEENQPANAPKQEIPLIDSSSPYADRIRGSVYSELYGLYRNLRPQLRPNKGLSDKMLTLDMHLLLSKMQLHYLRRNDMGNVFPMTGEERKELLELYRDCLRDCQRLPEKLRKKQEYKNLHMLLAKNEEQLRNAPEDELPPLADVIQGLQPQTIELIAQEKKTIGDAFSAREAVEYTDAAGNIRRGFFTAETTLTDKNEEKDAIVDKYDKQYPQHAEYFKKIKSIKNTDEFNDLLTDTYQYYERKNKEIKSDPVKAFFEKKKWVKPADIENAHFWNDTMIPLIREISDCEGKQSTIRTSGFETGDYLAERASAMKDVANALGYPDLLVGTRRVTVKRGDRKEEGVMMDPAGMELVDPAKLTDEDHPFYKVDTRNFHSREMLSSLADLQILDYLCANTDRHKNNFFLKMDCFDKDQPKLLGVQGIDNDNSFGNLVGGGVLKLAENKNLKIITPKMADAVEAMTEQQLQNILSPYHLSDIQVKAAEHRLKELQSMIKKGREDKKLHFSNSDEYMTKTLINPEGSIHIVQDDEWKKLNLSLLTTGKRGEQNLFSMALGHFRDYMKVQQQKEIFEFAQINMKLAVTQKRKDEILEKLHKTHPGVRVDAEGNLIRPENPENQKKSAAIRYTGQADKVDYRKLAELQKKELADLEEMKRRFDEAHGSLNDAKRSTKFMTMRSALEDLTNEYQRMRELDPAENLINGAQNAEQNRDRNLADCYARIEKKRQNLKEAIDTYLNIRHWKTKPSENNQKRINTARVLSDFVKDAPSSEQFYKSSKAVQDIRIKRETAQDAYEQNRYLTNQIHSMMKNTLLDNVNALKLDDPLREKGRHAVKAFEHLWNYSQNAVTVEKEPAQKKERVSMEELLREEQRKKAEALPDNNQLCEDLKTIKEYAPELSESINRILEEKDQIAPKRVGIVLNELYTNESRIAKERKEASKEKNMAEIAKEVQKRP